jgi:sensor histidine kinase YesM
VVWLLFATVPLLIFSSPPFNKTYLQIITGPYYVLFIVFYIFLFYFSTYYLIPKLYLQKKYSKYSISLFLLFVVFYFLKPFELMVYYNSPPPFNTPYDLSSVDVMGIFLFLVIVAVGIALQIVRQWRVAQLMAQKAEAEKLQALTDKKTAELSFLKAQINPHFLFNTLNTIYSLIRTQSPMAGDTVLKLSHIMRFVTDDVSSEYVALEKEIAFLSDFVNLHRLQHGKKVQLDFSVTGNPEDKKIAPLILMTYIENVFKYGISNHETAPIKIRLEISEDNIYFFCQNRIFATPRVAERTGIGLLNTQKRLEHLYPGTHELNITSTADLYTVTLKLPV